MNQHSAEQDSTPYRAHSNPSINDCRLVDDAVEEYALGIADPVQQAAIERHLMRCTRCADLVTRYQQTAAILALAVPLVEPPASARTALVSRIAATPQNTDRPASVFTGDLETFRTPVLPSSGVIATPGSSATSSRQNHWWRVYAAPLATLPLLLALGLVGAWGFNNYAKLNDANGVIAQKDQTIESMNDQLDFDGMEAVTLAFSPSAQRYTMASESNNSLGTLIADSMTGQAVLQVKGLAPGSYSILVQTQDGSMMQKAVFNVGDDGVATTAVDLGDQVTDFQSVHIRANSPIVETDVAVDAQLTDVMMAVIGPGINQGSGTGVQGP